MKQLNLPPNLNPRFTEIRKKDIPQRKSALSEEQKQQLDQLNEAIERLRSLSREE